MSGLSLAYTVTGMSGLSLIRVVPGYPWWAKHPGGVSGANPRQIDRAGLGCGGSVCTAGKHPPRS